MTKPNPDVDTLGAVKASISKLKKEEKALIAKITKSKNFDGVLFHSCISEYSKSVVNWKKMAMDLGATALRITKNTKKAPCTKFLVTAHIQDDKKAA